MRPWREANEFATRAGFRLPTEVEWEAIYSAGLGAGEPAVEDPGVSAWYAGNSEGPHEVGTTAPNDLGVYDLLGNVCEWCANGDSAAGSWRVARGGSWRSDAIECLPTEREDHVVPDVHDGHFGVRVVRDVTTADEQRGRPTAG